MNPVRAAHRSSVPVSRTILRLSAIALLAGAVACVPQAPPAPSAHKAGFVDDKLVLVPPGAEEGARLAKSHMWDEAIAAWRAAVQANPRSHALRYDLGLAHEMRGDLEAAESSYRHALTIRDEPLYVASLARVTGATGEGREHYRHLAGHAAMNGVGDAVDRGEIYARQGLWEEATAIWVPACEGAAPVAPVPEACHDLGVAAEQRGDVDEAVAFYTRAARIGTSPAPAVALRRLADERRAELANRYVTKQASNVRSGPGTRNARVALLQADTAVTKLEEKGRWWKVRLEDGREAWIHGKLLAQWVAPPAETETAREAPAEVEATDSAS